jgi:hypothetical protein
VVVAVVAVRGSLAWMVSMGTAAMVAMVSSRPLRRAQTFITVAVAVALDIPRKGKVD